MTERDDEVEYLQAMLRSRLGLRPETRLDVVIFRDGSAYEMQADGFLVRVR